MTKSRIRRRFPKVLRILLATNGLILFAGAMLGPIYALFVDEVGGDILDAGLAGGIFALTAGVTTIIAGKYADRIKETELFVVVGYALIGTGFLLYTQVHSVMTLLLVQVLIGIAEALYSPAFDALYSNHMDRRRSGTEWGTWEAMNYFTTAAGAAIGGLVASIFGFDTLFLIMAVLAFSSATYIYNLPRKIL